MRGISIFQKPHYREFRTMRGRPMRGLPVLCCFSTFGKKNENGHSKEIGLAEAQSYLAVIISNKYTLPWKCHLPKWNDHFCHILYYFHEIDDDEKTTRKV